MEKLAIDGGTPVRSVPMPVGKKVGVEELEELRLVIESGNLFRGAKVAELEKAFAELYGVKRAVSSTSGTSAIHVAMGMIGLSPGDEVITGPITDIGTVIPIIAQNGIPIFADLQPDTYNLDPASVESLITPKTKAIIAVHLFGNPSDLDALRDVADRHGIILVEDCAQAHLAMYKGKPVGTIGDIGCFSFQQSKQITTGDGGMTITNNDEYGDRGAIFIDKGWERWALGPRHYAMFGMNYRMTELQAAVGVAQLRKVKGIVEKRAKFGEMLTEMIRDCDAVSPQKVLDGCRSSYWYYTMTVRDDSLSTDKFAQALRAEGVIASAHYIGKPIFLCHDALRSKQIYRTSGCPFDCPHTTAQVEYTPGMCPTAESILDRLVVITVNEFMSESDINDIAEAIHKVARGLRR